MILTKVFIFLRGKIEYDTSYGKEYFKILEEDQ